MDEKLLELVIDDFRAGMVTNIDDPEKPINAFKELKNCRIDIKQGELQKRLQSTYYNEESLGANPIKSGTRYYYGTSGRLLIVSHDDTLKKGDDAAGEFTDIKTELTADKKWNFLTYKDKLYGCNGFDTNQRFDGTYIKDMGAQAPASAPTAGEGIDGDLAAGIYHYKITFLYDDYQESNAQTDDCVVIIAASKMIDISNIPVGAAGQSVTKRKIYRTKVGGSVYYFVATIDDNTTQTYTDNIGDLDLGDELLTNHDVPPIWKQMVLHKGRVFGLRPDSSRVDYTAIEGYNALPDIYDSVENYELINEDDGERVIGIAQIAEGVICFKRTNTFIIRTYSNDSVSWAIERIDVHGLAAPYSIASSSKGIIFLSLDKENQLDLRLLTGAGSISIGFRVKDILDSINIPFLEEVEGCFYGGRYYLSFIDNYSGFAYNHKILILQPSPNFDQFGFTMDDLKIGCFIPCSGAGDVSQIYAGASDEGRVLRLETTSIDFIHKTKTDIETGTLTRLTSEGTEEYPEYFLDETAMSGLFADTLIEDLAEEIEDYDDEEDDFIDYSGFITSDVLYLGDVKYLYTLLWSAYLPAGCSSAIRLRFGDTAAATLTASWSEFFTTPEGSDISGETPKKYFQYRLHLFSENTISATAKIYRDTFVVKLYSGLGSAFESYVNFLMDTGKIDLKFKDYIKRVRQLVLEYDTQDTVLSIYLAMDENNFGDIVESIDTNVHPNIRQIMLPFDYYGEYLSLMIQEQSLNTVRIKSIRIRYSLLPKQSYILKRG